MLSHFFQNSLCLSKLGRGQRLALLSTLAFFGSQLMGEAFSPNVTYFWGIGIGRILAGLMLVALPRTNGGIFRPWLVLLALGVACSGFGTSYTNVQLILIFALYLVLEIGLDVCLFTHSTEQEIPFDLGLLAAFRLAGMWCGLFLQLTPLAGISSYHIPNAIGALLLLFWLFCRESHEDSLLPKSWVPKKSRRLVFFETLAFLKQGWSAASLLNLFFVSVLAGLCAGAVLPYPLLHPDLTAIWLMKVFPNLQMLALALVVVWSLERARLALQLVLSALWSCGLVICYGLWGTPGEFLWGLLLASILIGGRALLRECFRTDVIIRATLLLSIWTLGALSGAVATQVMDRNTSILAQALCLAFTLVYSLWGYSHFSQPATELKKEAPVTERYGDNKQDFQAVPQAKRKKKRYKWQGLLDFVFVKFPVWMLLSIFLSASLLFGTHLIQSKKTWKETIDSAAKTFRAQLFLSAFRRRLTEDMLASQRVPSDWAQFIATNFEHEGKPLDDRDPWGTPYEFSSEPGRVVVTCAGADRLFSTADDLEMVVQKPQGVP